MTSHVKLRKEKTGTVDYDIQIKGKVTSLYYFANFLLFSSHPMQMLNTCFEETASSNKILTLHPLLSL